MMKISTMIFASTAPAMGPMTQAENAAITPHQIQRQGQQGVTQVLAQQGDGVGAHVQWRVRREKLVEQGHHQGGAQQDAHKGFRGAITEGTFEG